jgi:hypothetical protein
MKVLLQNATFQIFCNVFLQIAKVYQMSKEPFTEQKEHSIKEFNALIESIKRATLLNDNEIALRLGYNKGFIAQTRSRGNVSDKVMKSLRLEFQNELQNVMSRDVANRKEVEKEMPDIAGIQKGIHEMTLTMLSQVRSQQQTSEHLAMMEARLIEIEKKLSDLLGRPQHGKDGEAPKKTEVRVTRS